MEKNGTVQFTKSHLLFYAILALLLTWYVGIGNFQPQVVDYEKHHAVLRDLLLKNWPVTYTNHPFISEPVFLDYYLAWYLSPVFLAKLTSASFVELFVLIWSSIGLFLGFCWFVRIAKLKRFWWVLLLLFFGEILPKVYANRYAYNFSKFMSPPLNFLSIVLNPLSAILVNSTGFVHKHFHAKKQNLSMDDLSQALALTSNDIPEDRSILKGIVKFGFIEASEIMQARVDILAVDMQTPYKELLKTVFDSGYSRIPVYGNSIDDIKGILYIKDLLPYLDNGDDTNWVNLLRPPFYVPENKKINDLLSEFQSNKTHLAIVIDEYGGTSGLITLEDILEEIVGEISDESDDDEKQYREIDENNYIFDGKILLNDFYKILHIKDTVFDEIKGDADTLAGLLLELRGEIPALNDQISYKNFIFKVKGVDQRRIKLIHVTIVRKEEIFEE